MGDSPKPPGAGKSSFDLIDPREAFEPLGLWKGMVMLDVGCGPGDYSLYASPLIGPEGIIYAMDAWEGGLARLRERAGEKGLMNIRPLVADAVHLPLVGGSVDLALMATVLHDLAEAGAASGALAELRRVLRPQGVLGIIEFEKVEGPPGPPRSIRLSAEEVEKLVVPHGFRKERLRKIGPYNYLMVFRCDRGARRKERR